MKTTTILVSLAALLLAGSAEAKGKKSRPIVCESYSIIEDRGATEELVAVCDNGLTLHYWTEMTLPGPEGPKRVVVGYR